MSVLLQVLICTYADGINRIADARHPAVDGVEYLVSWQASSSIPVPEALDRPDFTIIRTPSVGLSANRNASLEAASAPLLLIADDDISYTPGALSGVIKAFADNPDCGLLTFRFASSSCHRPYPADSFDLRNPPRGYYVTSFEIAMRREILDIPGKKPIRFDERFGIGAPFCSQEESILVSDILHNGVKGKFIPVVVARHDGPTTSEKIGSSPDFIEAKGAACRYIYPLSWPLRMCTHALRAKRMGMMPMTSYLKAWLKGAVRLNSTQITSAGKSTSDK